MVGRLRPLLFTKGESNRTSAVWVQALDVGQFSHGTDARLPVESGTSSR